MAVAGPATGPDPSPRKSYKSPLCDLLCEATPPRLDRDRVNTSAFTGDATLVNDPVTVSCTFGFAAKSTRAIRMIGSCCERRHPARQIGSCAYLVRSNLSLLTPRTRRSQSEEKSYKPTPHIPLQRTF